MPALSTAQQNLRPPPRVPARLNLSLPFESNPTLRRWGRLSNTLLEKKRLLDRTRQMRELNFQKELPFVSSLREELDRRTAPRPVVAPDTPPKQRQPLPESPWERLYRTEEERLTARDLLAQLPNSVRTVVMMAADPRNLIPVESFEAPLRNIVARARAGDALALAEITRNRGNLDRVTDIGSQIIRAQAQRDDNLTRFKEVERRIPAVRSYAAAEYNKSLTPNQFVDTFKPGRDIPEYAKEGVERLKTLQRQAAESITGKIPEDMDTAEELTQHAVLHYAGIRIRQGVSFEQALTEAEQNAEAHGFAERYIEQVAKDHQGLFSKIAAPIMQEIEGAKRGIGAKTHYGEKIAHVAGGVYPPDVLINPDKYSDEQLRVFEREAGGAVNISQGMTEAFDAAEGGRKLSRPVVLAAQDALARAISVPEAAIQETTGLQARGTISDVVRAEVVTDVGSDLFNPVYIGLFLPMALEVSLGRVGARSGVSIAARIASNLIGTGAEPEIAAWAMRRIPFVANRMLRPTVVREINAEIAAARATI